MSSSTRDSWTPLVLFALVAWLIQRLLEDNASQRQSDITVLQNALTETMRTTAEAIAVAVHRDAPLPALAQPTHAAPAENLFASYYDSQQARDDGFYADPTDAAIPDERIPGQAATVPAGFFAETGGDLVRAFKEGRFQHAGNPIGEQL